MITAVTVSAILHAAALWLFSFFTNVPLPPPAASPEEKPLYFELDPEMQRQLLETSQASETPPENRDVISDKNAQAADKEIKEGIESGPSPDIEDDAKLLAAAPEPQEETPPPQEPSQPQAPSPPQPAMRPEKQQETAKHEENPEKQPAASNGFGEKQPETSEENAHEDSETQLAMAPPIPPAPPVPQAAPAPPQKDAQDPAALTAERKQPSRGSIDNEVVNKGFTNFEAIQDEIAPYLLEIKKYVERRWIEALLTRYTGAKPTKAIVECAIRPDGTIASASVSGLPDEPVFASLCRQAIERAGPFRPFPFTVPDIYRNQNLEIRWTFNFL